MVLPTPGQAMWNQRRLLADHGERLCTLVEAVGRPSDLAPFQWAQILALTMEFQPDLVIELGRGWGNSTCCFLEAAALMRPEQPCRLISLCKTDDWVWRTKPRLQALCNEDWFAAADCRQADILQTDLAHEIEKSQRCLVFWDAHGFEVAEWVLGRLLPLLNNRPHMVLMHDMTDLRYCSPIPDYGDHGLWNGMNAGANSFWLGHINSSVAQAISIVDFTSRNRLHLHSAEETLFSEIGTDPAKRAELQNMLVPDLFSLQAYWFWFSLNEATGPITFPRFTPNKSSAAAINISTGESYEQQIRKFARRGMNWTKKVVRRYMPIRNAHP